jgi:hypothetical protein
MILKTLVAGRVGGLVSHESSSKDVVICLAFADALQLAGNLVFVA